MPLSVLSNTGAIRLPEPTPEAPPPAVDVYIGPIGPQGVEMDDGTTITEMPDGSVVVSDDKPRGTTGDFDENLADNASPYAFASLAEEIIQGIEADILSRQDWVATYTKGMDLLGLKIEQSSSVRNRKRTSTVVHPLMLEAIVRFQSAARAELLPSAGPVKVKNDGDETEATNEQAQDLEKDFNHYLTTTATEYYPDTDRALFYLGYGGTIFKKVYNCPLRRRPVSESVYLPHLIVSNDATDLENAARITHEIPMSQADFRRLQINGFYLDVPLMEPDNSINAQDQIRQKEDNLQGRSTTNMRPQDTHRTIWECYTEFDPAKYGLAEDAPEGLPLPYVVSIDKTSRRIVALRRNWDPDDLEEGFDGKERLSYRRKKIFVKYELIPGFGFLGLGYLHLLGNQTRTLTAAVRLMIDAGMFSNYPAGFRVKGTRQSTNEFTPGPGEFQEIETGPMDDIRKAIMALPYKDPSPVFMELMKGVEENARRIGGAVEMEVGEGRTNVPVGTVMAMVEQQTQVMAAVHKRLHSSQQQEFGLLKALFIEDPEAISRGNPEAKQWTAEALKNSRIVPAADPNVPAQVHRIMQATAIKTLSSASPELYDQKAVDRRILRTIGVDDPDTLFAPPAPQQGGDPTTQMLAQAALITAKSEQENATTKRLDAVQKNQNKAKEIALDERRLVSDQALSAAEIKSKEGIAARADHIKAAGIVVDAAKDTRKEEIETARHALDLTQKFGE